jgi:dipeptidyl aminopeptidase/acylaminoacyl peptidase
MRSLTTFLLILSLAFSAWAQGQLPPIIDRDLFFGEVEIAGAQISPDGKFIAFLKPYKGVRNVWVKKESEPFSAAKPVTAEAKRPVGGFFWSRDSKFILYSQDRDGDENFNVFAVNPSEAPAAGAEMPATRALTDLKGVRVFIYAVPKNKPGVIYVGLNDRDKAWHDLYLLKLATGERTLIRKNTDRVGQWFFDNKGDLRLAVRSADNGDQEVLRVDADNMTKIYSCSVLEACGPVRFDKRNEKVYFVTNQGARDLVELTLLDPASGQTTLVESDKNRRVDFGEASFSDVTDELIATAYVDDRVRIEWRDKKFEADYNWIKSQLGGDYEVGLTSATADESMYIVNVTNDREPSANYLFNRKTRKLDLLFRVRDKLPRQDLAEMKPIRYESSDGLEIPGYLTLPKGVPAKDLPLVVMPHGGPWARDNWGYNSYAQFLANRGYAVLMPNFRASTGYGKNFLNKGNAEWGRKMQDDITWGVKYLTQKGIVDPKRAGIMGGSYGGYATLAGVAFTPDVYAAGVSIVGPSNLQTLLDSIPPYWEAFRKVLYARTADPSTPEGKKRLQEMSPLYAASKIKTPLQIQQGANDPRVNKAESDQIVIALRDRGFPVEYIVAPDEGHGFARPVNRTASIIAVERFFSKHLGGRVQEGGSPEATARLAEITVDPKTVTLPKKVEAAVLPTLAVKPAPAVNQYANTIQVGGQTIAMDVVMELKQEGGKWLASDIMTSPMGEMKDVAELDPATMAVRKRTLTQGPAVIELAYADGKVTGAMKMNGQERTVSADLGGDAFADSAGSTFAIAALPLADGYTTTYRNFDFQKAKLRLMTLKVTGSASVTVPAGTFDAWLVEVVPAEGGAERTVYSVAKSNRKVVKVEAVLPQLGGAKMTAELK